MTAVLEKQKIDECLWLLSAGDKAVADKYCKELEKASDYKFTRIEAILQVVSDELAAEVERELQAEEAKHYKGITIDTEMK